MTVARLTDVFLRPVYDSYTSLNDPSTTALFKSGLIATNAALTALAKGGNKVGTVPFWLDLDATGEPDYTNDDPADYAVPDKVSTSSMDYHKAYVHKAYGEMDLVAELMAGDGSPLQHIKNRFGFYWTRQLQKRLISSAKGILADNVANDAGDMLVDASAVVFSSGHAIDAMYQLGDWVGNLSGFAVHSQIARSMALDDQIDYIRDSDGKVVLAIYQGKVLVIDDTLPVTGAGDNRVFTSIAFGAGAFGFGGAEGHVFGMGEGSPKNPSYAVREELSGNGGGQEIIGERKTWLLHPFGFSFIPAGGGALTEFSPTLANLETAAKWNRIVPRKNVPMAFIKSKAAPATALV
jgi:hypothetical protein